MLLQATHTSFMAMVSVVEQFSVLREYFGQVCASFNANDEQASSNIVFVAAIMLRFFPPSLSTAFCVRCFIVSRNLWLTDGGGWLLAGAAAAVDVAVMDDGAGSSRACFGSGVYDAGDEAAASCSGILFRFLPSLQVTKSAGCQARTRKKHTQPFCHVRV